MTGKADWQDAVGRSWAASWTLTDRSFSGLTAHLLARIAEHGGEAVLDIGCGAGELSLAVARARPRARVIGLDVSAELVAAARARAGEGSAVRFEVSDAATWSEPGFAPDLLVSRHGVMFFDDPEAAFAQLHAVAAPGASLVFSCFRSARENPWASGIAELLGLPPGDPLAPGPFAFADPRRVEAILVAGNWAQIAFEPVDFAWIAGTGAHAEDEALDFFGRIGPAAPVLRAMDAAGRSSAEAMLREQFRRHRSGDVVAFSAAAWIVTAHYG